MPAGASIAKVEPSPPSARRVTEPARPSTRRSAAARDTPRRRGWRSSTRSTTPVVMAGQGGLGLELLAQVPDVARVIVPVGGGGLVSGVAIALKSQRPEVEVIGVQVETCAPFPESLARVRRSRSTRR